MKKSHFIITCMLSITTWELVRPYDPPRSEPIKITNEMRRTECAKDFQCMKLAEAMVYEARGGGLPAMEAVGFVIQNRIEADGWASDVYSVIHDPRQFSYLRNMYRQKQPREEDWELALEVGYKIMQKEVDDTTNGALYYHSTKLAKRPKWTKKTKYLFERANHRFYK